MAESLRKHLFVEDHYCSAEKADELLQHCLKDLTLEEKPSLIVHGKQCHMNRSVGFFSDAVKNITYSHQSQPSQPLTPLLSEFLEKVNKDFDQDFNSVLINLYKDGNDYIGEHSDQESHLSKDGWVVGLSLGAERIFRVRHKTTKEKTDVTTKHGQLLVMGYGFQKTYSHSVPIQKKILGPRVSLTLRRHNVELNK